jgi:hypothetical protein
MLPWYMLPTLPDVADVIAKVSMGHPCLGAGACCSRLTDESHHRRSRQAMLLCNGGEAHARQPVLHQRRMVHVKRSTANSPAFSFSLRMPARTLSTMSERSSSGNGADNHDDGANRNGPNPMIRATGERGQPLLLFAYEGGSFPTPSPEAASTGRPLV